MTHCVASTVLFASDLTIGVALLTIAYCMHKLRKAHPDEVLHYATWMLVKCLLVTLGAARLLSAASVAFGGTTRTIWEVGPLAVAATVAAVAAVYLACRMPRLLALETPRERAERAVAGHVVELEERNAQVKALLAELNHRVGNNLQNMQSLTRILGNQVKDSGGGDEVEALLQAFTEHLEFMAEEHRQLSTLDYAGNPLAGRFRT